MASNPALCEEDARAVRGGLATLSPWADTVIPAIRKALKLDFFGMDLGVQRDGRLVLFEANATMNFLPISTDPAFPYGREILENGRRAVDAMMADALERPGLVCQS